MIGPISDFIRDLTLAHLFRNAPERDPTVLYPRVRQYFYSVTSIVLQYLYSVMEGGGVREPIGKHCEYHHYILAPKLK